MSDIVVDKGTFLKQVDFSMASSINSAATIDLGATDGNTVIVIGTTNISDLGTAPQAGVRRTMLFTDALDLIYGINLLCFGEADITTDAGDVAEFVALSTTQWRMISYSKLNGYSDGKLTDTGIKDKAIISSKLNDACVTNSKLKTKGLFSLTDSASILLATNLINKTIFVITPTTHRVQTTDTALNIIASIPTYQIGTWFEFVIVNLAAFNVTLAPGTDVTLVGNLIANNNSASFIGIVTSSTEITIYRK